MTDMPAATEAQWQKTSCILCECNCGLEVLLDGRRLAKIRGDKTHPTSLGYSCEKPLRLDQYQNGAHRLDTPLRRLPDGTHEPIDWDTALDEIAARLLEIKADHGGDKICFGDLDRKADASRTFDLTHDQVADAEYDSNPSSGWGFINVDIGRQ